MLLCVLMLALPSAASAQSAGDNQYQDPFAGQAPSNSTPKQAPSGGGANSGATAQATPQAGQQAAQPSSATTTQTQSSATLPRTGFSTALPLAYGLVLLLGGAALRRGARPRIQ